METPFLRSCSKWDRKGEDSGWIEIRQVEPRNRLVPLSGKKPQEQNHAVAIAVDGAVWSPEGGEGGQ